ncbi:MAG: hypothetical protein AB8I08_06945 [Sandaracinaceae bacterium]
MGPPDEYPYIADPRRFFKQTTLCSGVRLVHTSEYARFNLDSPRRAAGRTLFL